MKYQMNDLNSVFAAYNPKTGKNEPPVKYKPPKKEDSKNNEKSSK